MYTWFERGWFMPDGFRRYRGPPVVVWDSYTREKRTLLPGSQWWHRDDRVSSRVVLDDPGILVGFVECEGEVCVWWHRLAESKRWKNAVPMGAYPWGLREFVLDMRPSPEHPVDWAKPTVWDRLASNPL